MSRGGRGRASYCNVATAAIFRADGGRLARTLHGIPLTGGRAGGRAAGRSHRLQMAKSGRESGGLFLTVFALAAFTPTTVILGTSGRG